MLARPHPRLTFANVCSFLALLIALGTGSAYAANTVFSTDIVDGQVKAPDIDTNAVTTAKLRNGNVNTVDIADDAVDGSKILDSSVGAADLGSGSVGSSEIQTDGVGASEISDNSIDGGEIIDNSLTASDIHGADRTGHISYGLGANACSTLSLSVSGAQVGEVSAFSFTGSGPFDKDLQITPLSVTSAGTVATNFCNLGGSSINVSDAPVRVMTFS